MLQKICIFLFFSINFTLATEPEDLYLDLIKKCINGTVYCDPPAIDDFNPYDRNLRLNVEMRLPYTLTLLTESGLKTLRYCMEEVEKNKVPGDFIETGVWRGGATIFMRAFLKVKGNCERKVWVADSFSAFPTPTILDMRNTLPKGYPKIPYPILMEEVQANFMRYNLYDEQVVFLKGFFKDTLPVADIQKLAVLRLDGDLYESTKDALNCLYPKLSVGGYVIIDDYGVFEGCRLAVTEYLLEHQIDETIMWEDWTGIYWQKTK